MTDLPEVRISGARDEDLPQVAALAASALREAWSEAGFAETAAGVDTCLLVARCGDALAGYVLARRVVDELHVLSLAVAGPLRRRGLGRALLATLEAAWPGAATVQLEVRDANAAARAFYAALGYREVGRRRRYYPDGEDAILLSRAREAAGPEARA